MGRVTAAHRSLLLQPSLVTFARHKSCGHKSLLQVVGSAEARAVSCGLGSLGWGTGTPEGGRRLGSGPQTSDILPAHLL